MSTYIVRPNVELGQGCKIGDFVIIGEVPKSTDGLEPMTRIGPNAVIRSHTVIYLGNVIGANFQSGHGVMLREGNQIGDNVSVGTHSIVEHHVKIGDRVRIHSNVFIPEFSSLEEDVWIGPNVVLTNALYPLSPYAKANLKGPQVMAQAKLGANSTILPGVVIGRNALVGAGSVVVRDVPDNKVVVGNPARVIKDVAELSAYQIEQAIHPGDSH